MTKIPECNYCLFYSYNPYLHCAVHPGGVIDSCLDFQPKPNAEPEELWEPEGASYYNGELILHRPRLTPEQQLELLDTHPLFTGICPECGHAFEMSDPSPGHWDCPRCEWVEDSV